MSLTVADVWEEWKQLTRFLECTRIAFQRELTIWDGLEVESPASIKLSTQNGLSRFSINANEHIETLKDEALLYFIVLTYSYSLCECYARVKLGMGESDRLISGIEAWGTDLLNLTGNSWNDVLSGKAGLIEVAVVRNFIAHGSRAVSSSTINRFINAGETCPWGVGDVVTLDYLKVEEYRSRLKSLMRFSNS